MEKDKLYFEKDKSNAKKEGHRDLEKQREIVEKEFLKLSQAVDDLRIKEAEIRSSLVSLDKFKTFLEKKENGQLTEEDLANKEDLIMREALLEYAFKSSRFNRIQEELLLKNQENQKLQKDLIEKKEKKKQL